MIDNVVSEQLGQRVEQKTPRLLYRPEAARKSLGEYFIDDGLVKKINTKNIVDDFLNGRDLELIHQKQPPAKKEHKRNIFGKRIKENSTPVDIESQKEKKFISYVQKYDRRVISEIEAKGELIEDNQDKLLDPLSIGILYKMSKTPEFEGVISGKDLNFKALLVTEQFKTAKKTVLLALSEGALDRIDDPKDTTEFDMFARYARARLDPDKLPKTNQGWKNFFITSLENGMLEDYFVNFRFSLTEEVVNSRNIFKLGEIITGEMIEANRQAGSKIGEITNFARYEDRERGFAPEKQGWRKKIIEETKRLETKNEIDSALHGKNQKRHRSEQAVIDKGLLEQRPDGKFAAKGEFIKIFAELYQGSKENPDGENQLVLGMLYSMRHELGVGVLPRTEVLRRAKEIIPALERAGVDTLLSYINQNFDEFSRELRDYVKAGLMPGNDDTDVIRQLTNLKYVDGFAVGESIGKILKGVAREKKAEDNVNLKKLETQTGDENSTMKLLIEGKDIKDQQIYDRLERTANRTLRFKHYIELIKNTTPSKALTRMKVGAQKILFYSEGDSPFATKPDLLGKTKSVLKAGLRTALIGHGVNYFTEEPVHRGFQAVYWMADFFMTDEVMPLRRELKAKKKEVRQKELEKVGLSQSNEIWLKKYLLPFSKDKREYRKKYKEIMGSYWNPLSKNNRSLEKYVKKETDPLRREINKRFWHNKGKLLYSFVSYGITSFGVNYLLNKIGMTGPEAWAVLMATNTAASSLLSGAGLRSGAEFIVDSWLGSKKAVDGGMELLTGNKREAPVKTAKPKFHFKYKIIDKPFQTLKNKAGNAFATNIAPNIIKIGRKIPYVNEVMTRHTEENQHLQVLEKFVENKNNPDAKISKEELIESLEFLTLMKEEEGMLLIHNSRYYEKRLIRQPDGSFVEVDNREGLKNIDKTRREIIEYAQNNLPKEDCDEVSEVALEFYSDIKNIRKKVFSKRMKYLAASYGYRVTFMVMSHALQYEGGLLEKPMNKIFGSATENYQYIIEKAPTTVFHANVETPKGQEALAKEVWARAEELNNLVNLMGTSDQLSQFQPGVESHLAYYGVNQQQIELLVDNLGKSNLNTSDLMRVIYVLSSYKEGQEYLATVSGFEGTERRDLAPMITNIAVDPVGFMDRAMEDKGNATLILLKYPDIAEKLGIKPESLAEQLNPLVIPESVKDQMLASNANNPIVISTVGPQIIKVGDVVAEFVDGLTPANRESKIDQLNQLNNIYGYDSSMIQQAVNHNFNSFLAESHDLVGTELTNKSINDLPIDSMIYKMYQAFDENGQIVPLLNRAKEGDVNAYNQLYALLEAKYPNDKNLFHGGLFVTSDHSVARDQILDSQVDTEIYDKVLNNLPGDEALRKEEIVRRIQQEMIGLGLRPVSAPIMDLDEMTNLNHNPDIFTDPREALMHALSPGNSDLEMAVALTGNTRTLFVQNEQVVGDFKRDLQYSVEYSPEDLAILKAIEGSESDNNRLTFPKILGKNLAYVFGFRDTASGTTPPAGSLIEMMTGPFGHGAMNPEAPAALHNYDAYGPGYLSKLIIAHFRGRVPDELLEQMGPNADLTQSIHDKDPSWIDRLCNKFETLIAEKVLVAKYGEDKVGEVYLNHAILGTVDGIDIKGVEAASQVLYGKPFSELTLGEKFLIEAVGQSPRTYLYEDNLNINGNLVPNPARAINHAIHIIEDGKIGNKLDIYLPGGKEQILADLHAMDDRVKDEGWEKVFNMHLPDDVQNFATTPDAARFTGMTDEQIAEAIKNGEIKGVTFTNDGIRVIELNNIVIEETSRAIPEDLMTPYELTAEQRIEGQLAAQYSAAITGATLDGNFYTTPDGTQIPAWWTVFVDKETGKTVETVVPGMAVVSITGGSENIVSIVDPTGQTRGPQLVGSIFKLLVTDFALVTYPDYENATFDASPIRIGEHVIRNSVEATDYAGMISIPQTLASSANTSMYRLWESMSARDPNFWEHFQKFSRDQWGIVYYEVNDKGNFVPLTHPPTPDAAFGNIYVGGVDVNQNGLVKVAEAYKVIGEAGYMGKVVGNHDVDTAKRYVDAGRIVLSGLTDKSLKIGKGVFSPEQIEMFEGAAGKTGTQTGVDQYGNWIAIRAGTYFIKYYPATESTPERVDVIGVMTFGKDKENNPIELNYASQEVLPIVSKMKDSLGVEFSLFSAKDMLNSLIATPETSQIYQLGAVDAQQLFPFLRDLSPPDEKGDSPYNALRDAILHDKTKYLFVDLIGPPINGEVQPIAIHFIDKDGANKIFTLSVPADLIEPAGPLINQFSDTSSQTAIVELLTQAVQSEPEKYGGLLAQLQGQGINFVPVHDYEVSPALFAIHEQMEKNGMLFSGAEDNGAVMKQLGLDPKTTVFVNDELFKALNQENPEIIKEQLFVQREYLAMASIYESSGLPGALDSLIYDKDMTSNPSYQLLKIFAETKTSQVFKPVDGERQFLINQFQSLMSDPVRAKELAPDVIAAYNLYNQLSEGIARGVTPDPVVSQNFIDALNNFDKTTQERTLLSLGITPNQPAQNIQSSTPLPSSILSSVPLQPMMAGVSLDALQTSSVTAMELVNNFIKHPEKFDFMNNEERATASLVINNANLILSIVESHEAKNLEGLELNNYITKKFEANNISVDDAMKNYISLFSYNGKQCGAMNLMINNALTKIDPVHFKELGPLVAGVPKDARDTAEAFIADLVNSGQDVTFNEGFVKKIANDITDLNPGDSVVALAPWMGDNDPGHMVKVVMTGEENGKPYALIFESNFEDDGKTQFRKIFSLNDLIREEAWTALQLSYPKLELATLPEPIFGTISVAEPAVVLNP